MARAAPAARGDDKRAADGAAQEMEISHGAGLYVGFYSLASYRPITFKEMLQNFLRMVRGAEARGRGRSEGR
ncbi:hypothetical protein BN2476_570004 [Paraburkholderia piptadeniae]|uniref:Uncharacterized protein n=1 Tax=Paraburkholderia piptadeniae TaxID=1701573 RepID=A0A1N7SJ20_9BURK|nr:hypothetical protein BN2476_570004 [Paraburkholderia piptadeniae]